MGNFLPEDYVPPTATSDYMKLVAGSNRFRWLGSFKSKPPTAIMGWEAWDEDANGRRPIRFRMADQPAAGTFNEDAKHFWAFTVFNVQDKVFQILELTQKSILNDLGKLIEDPEWGNPSGPDGYDIEIFRVGEGKETRYQTQPKPRAPMDPLATELARPVNLDALFTGENPFEVQLTEKLEEEGPPF